MELFTQYPHDEIYRVVKIVHILTEKKSLIWLLINTAYILSA